MFSIRSHWKCLLIAASVVLLSTPSHAIVTSNGFGTHQTTPGQPAFGVDVDGVSRLRTFDINGNTLSTCTAADTGGGIITAAHCLSDPNIHGAIVSYDVPGLSSYSAYLADWAVHPAFNGIPGTGYDVAAATLYGPLWPTPSYPLYRGGGGAEVGEDIVRVGYGLSGWCLFGESIADATKRAGRNTIDEFGLSGPQYAVDSDLDGLVRADQQLTYDFDSGSANHDGFARLFGHGADTGHGVDEVGSAHGDSGGPTFAMIDGQWQIVGVASYIMSLTTDAGISSDINGIANNASWGEFAADTRVASPAIHRFVDHFLGWSTAGDIIGDLNSNGDLDGGDIDLIFDSAVDLNGDGTANNTDIDFLVEELSGTAFGDVDLDRDVDFADYLVLSGNYGQSNQTWADGDFNGDSVVNFSDFLLLSGNYGFDENVGIGSGSATFSLAAPVPEPACCRLLMAVLPLVLLLRRKRNIA